MKSFPAKVMLLGEYTVIKGSKAVAVPYDKYNGNLSRSIEQNEGSRNLLLKWLGYLQENNELQWTYDLAKFEADINDKITFECSAPIGYGMGSSGILTAAFFDMYCLQTDKMPLKLLQQELGRIESFFHGKSSGLDPLVSYLQKSICIQKDAVDEITIPQEKLKNFYLLNTGMKRKTAPLVNIFLEKCEKSFFAKHILQPHVQLVDSCIDTLLHSNHSIEEEIKAISLFTHNHFKEMIPQQLMPAWEYGLASKKYYLKLCGAGGGGFMLVYTNNAASLNELKKQYEINAFV